jgi:hypothetical protein
VLKEALIDTLEEDEEGTVIPGVSLLVPEYSLHCGAVIRIIQLVIRLDVETVKRKIQSPFFKEFLF